MPDKCRNRNSIFVVWIVVFIVIRVFNIDVFGRPARWVWGIASGRAFRKLSDSMDAIPVKLMTDGRSNRTGTAVTSWIGGMSITQDGNLIAPDKIMTHIHRYASPHYNPHGHHYHRWNHEPGGSEDPLYATKTVYGPGYIDENRTYGSFQWTLANISRFGLFISFIHF